MRIENIKKFKLFPDLKWFLIASVIGILVAQILPAGDILTSRGTTFIGVFVACIILFCAAQDQMMASIFAIVTMAVFCHEDFMGLATNALINTAVIYTFGGFILAHAMTKSGMTEYIAKWFMSRDGIKGHPYAYLAAATAAFAVIAILTFSAFTLVLLTALCSSALNKAGIEKGTPIYKANMLVFLWITPWAELAIPYGKPLALACLAYCQQYGVPIDYFSYMKISIPLFIAFVLVIFIVVRLFIRPKAEDISGYDPQVLRKEMLEIKLSKRSKFSLAMVLLTFALMVLQGVASIPFVSTHIIQWGAAAYFIPIVLLCLIPFDGEPALNLKKDINQLNYPILFFLAAVMMFSGYIGKEEYGLSAWLISVFTPLNELLSPVGMMAVAVIATVILTNFISNFVAMAISVSIFTPVMAALYGSGASIFSPALTIILVVFAANISCLVPSSCFGAAFLYGGFLKVKNSFISNIALLVLGTALLIVGGFALVRLF